MEKNREKQKFGYFTKVPEESYFHPYVVLTLHELGGLVRKPKEITERVAKKLRLSSKVLEEKRSDKKFGQLSQNIHSALRALSKSEYVDYYKGDPFRWRLSEKGKEIVSKLIKVDSEFGESNLQKITDETYKEDEIYKEWNKIHKKWDRVKGKNGEGKETKQAIDNEEEGSIEDEIEEAWEKQKQLDIIIKKMDPYAFERLCKRLLKKMNYKDVEVTSRSGDGGIDGYGFLTFGLVKFKVVFEAKKWKRGSKVRRKLIRDFIGSRTVEKAEKSVFITTSDFAEDAEELASESDIECINGERLIELLQEHELGYSVESVIKEYKFHPDYFDTV